LNVINNTNLHDAQRFMEDKMSRYDTENLTVRMHAKPIRSIYSGLCTYPIRKLSKKTGKYRSNYAKGDYKIKATINSEVLFPRGESATVGTISFEGLMSMPLDGARTLQEKYARYDSILNQEDKHLCDSQRGFFWIKRRIGFTCLEEMMVFLLGHEMWHYMCRSGKMKGTGQRNTQARADKEGVAWLQEFKTQRRVMVNAG